MNLNGIVKATQLISVRFPSSGKLSWIKCAPGNLVSKGTSLAALDESEIQAQLEIELADFRRIRAEFDKVSRELPEAKNEDEKAIKQIAQSKLEVATKAVEKTKLQLDALKLICPIDAVVLSTEGLLPGVNLTPGSFPIELADTTSTVFALEVDEDSVYQLKPGQKGKVELKSGFNYDSEIIYLSPRSQKSKFEIHFKLPPLDLTNFRLGTTGCVSL